MAHILFLVLGQLYFLPFLDALTSSPKVQVYSHHPPDSNKENFLNCYVSGFHPPQITIELLKDGQKIEKVEQSDLSFSNDWTFNCLVSTSFDPNSKNEYACRVTHSTLEKPKVINWDPENN